MKRRTLLAVFATGMVLGIGAAACGVVGTSAQTETNSTSVSEDGTESGDTLGSGSDSSGSDSNTKTNTTSEGSSASALSYTSADSSVLSIDTSDMFTDRDLDTGYDEANSSEISFGGDSISCADSSVKIDGSTVTISSAGTYILSGTLTDGQIIVDAADTDKVQLVLNGVSVTNDDSACILVKSADKVFVTLAAGTENTLSDTGAEYTQTDDSYNVDGVIFSRDDITFNGSGTLTITASYANGIVGKDDVKFTGGTYNITTTGNAIEGKDSVRIKGGTFNLTAGDNKDGIHTSNDEEDGKGYIYFEGGDITINAKDDGIHAESALYITGGSINITESYEGLEGDTIDILGGDIKISASDDGINASTGNSESSGNGGPGGFMDYDENAYIKIYGGDIYVNASGDGIDSNGDLYVYGGNVTVDGPTNDGNGPLDKGGTAYIYGGTVIAVGSSTMAETFSSDSEQYSILYGFESTLEAGTEITITDADGTVLMDYTLNKSAASVVFSSADIAEGEYTITAGSVTDTITVSDKSTTAGSATGGFMPGNFGGMKGGPGPQNGEAPSFENGEPPQLPDGEMPSFENGERPQMPDSQAPDFKNNESQNADSTEDQESSDASGNS